ncbi:hypothetical protein P7K49_013210 [Saguinus oedipus]|uniref:Uncharacterized protein n=1 Tax=Saguinus oedipus TaxID=9490 RepID=A0ABQ9VG32_SAGOE|nr:hypothetical protein P7K49_013210 [Saguinus oedipus]
MRPLLRSGPRPGRYEVPLPEGSLGPVGSAPSLPTPSPWDLSRARAEGRHHVARASCPLPEGLGPRALPCQGRPFPESKAASPPSTSEGIGSLADATRGGQHPPHLDALAKRHVQQ